MRPLSELAARRKRRVPIIPSTPSSSSPESFIIERYDALVSLQAPQAPARPRRLAPCSLQPGTPSTLALCAASVRPGGARHRDARGSRRGHRQLGIRYVRRWYAGRPIVRSHAWTDVCKTPHARCSSHFRNHRQFETFILEAGHGALARRSCDCAAPDRGSIRRRETPAGIGRRLPRITRACGAADERVGTNVRWIARMSSKPQAVSMSVPGGMVEPSRQEGGWGHSYRVRVGARPIAGARLVQ
ncbi:hypothetical protein AURDEDRAFT_177732 [Auricularia subglabra TFB-10046 SS5]|uniref:Uncharacterized protein n=1 Tax=Auricularia subglabra (strain TFB-10046 / SS5) TaxID=717982 RepID=J0L9W5_AURST|nr:hypothetical protein AURDEDRAFT_177732 [Auricularia subglabra TFB-10046 SS5]